MRRLLEAVLGQFALERLGRHHHGGGGIDGTSAASARPRVPEPCGKRACTYSGKRVWNEVVKAMPCLRQMRARGQPQRAFGGDMHGIGREFPDLAFRGAAREQGEPDFGIGRQRKGEPASRRGVAHRVAEPAQDPCPASPSVRTTPLTWGAQASVTIRIFKWAATPGKGPGSRRLDLRGYKRGLACPAATAGTPPAGLDACL